MLRPVNNAAGGEGGPILCATQAGIERTFATIVYGSIFMMQAAAPYMPRGGRIINIGSVASKLGAGDLPLYSAAKAAMDQLTYAVAAEVSVPSNISPQQEPHINLTGRL